MLLNVRLKECRSRSRRITTSWRRDHCKCCGTNRARGTSVSTNQRWVARPSLSPGCAAISTEIRTVSRGRCYSANDRAAEYCDERVCVCVCVCVCQRSYLRNYTSDLHQIFVHVTYSRGSVLSRGVVVRYALPVPWMTSYMLISQGCSTSTQP